MSDQSSASQRRVLLLADANSTALGAEKHVADLLTRLPQEGFLVALGCPAGGDLGTRAARLGLPYFALGFDAAPRASTLLALKRAIGRTSPDVIHVHGSRSAAYARAFDPAARRRIIYTVHGVHAGRTPSRVRRFALTTIERTLRHRVARFVTVCAADVATGTRLGLLDPGRTTIVHNGLDLPLPQAPAGRFRAELGITPYAPLVLSVGRLHPQKDQTTLLRAWATVAAARPDAVLALVGSGPLGDSLRHRVRVHDLSRSVRLVPARPDLSGAYTDADAFVLSSRWEGLPYAILEAMAYGLPVVSTSVDGIPEAVDDGVTGALVPPQDPAALASAMLHVLEDASEAAALGRAGQAKVEREFGLDRMVAQLAAVYREVAAPA